MQSFSKLLSIWFWEPALTRAMAVISSPNHPIQLDRYIRSTKHYFTYTSKNDSHEKQIVSDEKIDVWRIINKDEVKEYYFTDLVIHKFVSVGRKIEIHVEYDRNSWNRKKFEDDRMNKFLLRVLVADQPALFAEISGAYVDEENGLSVVWCRRAPLRSNISLWHIGPGLRSVAGIKVTPLAIADEASAA